MMKNLLILGTGGVLGTWARFGISTLSYRAFGTAFPWGTLAVNAAGSFVVGFLVSFAGARGLLTPGLRLFAVIGFLGAFTTFSSLTYESWEMMRSGMLARALANVAANLVLGFAALFAGVLLAQALAAARAG